MKPLSFSKYPEKGSGWREHEGPSLVAMYSARIFGRVLVSRTFHGPGESASGRRLEEIGGTMGLASVTLRMGPYSMEDTFGMGLAVCILVHTLDPGKTE
jgi:hypothetical protein